MVSRRASFTAWAVVRIALGSTVVLGASGCGLLKHGDSPTDAGTDAATASATSDAAPAAPPTPDNVNNVGRFPDEVSLSDAPAKVEEAMIAARNAVPGGALVANLRKGTTVTQVAKHGSFVLCIFPDPKDATHTLEGWVAEQAFTTGSAPSQVGCPTGEITLMADGHPFCGRVCKNNSDCVPGQVCEGKANLVASGKPGAETTTCTVSAASAGGAIVAPAANGTCGTGYFLLGNDKQCHRDCAKTACPAPTHCQKVGAQSFCEN
jgi:hypothetical protein